MFYTFLHPLFHSVYIIKKSTQVVICDQVQSPNLILLVVETMLIVLAFCNMQWNTGIYIILNLFESNVDRPKKHLFFSDELIVI